MMDTTQKSKPSRLCYSRIFSSIFENESNPMLTPLARREAGISCRTARGLSHRRIKEGARVGLVCRDTVCWRLGLNSREMLTHPGLNGRFVFFSVVWRRSSSPVCRFPRFTHHQPLMDGRHVMTIAGCYLIKLSRQICPWARIYM